MSGIGPFRHYKTIGGTLGEVEILGGRWCRKIFVYFTFFSILEA